MEQRTKTKSAMRRDAPTKSRREVHALGTERKSPLKSAMRRDAPIMSRMEEFAEGMEQRNIPAATRDAPTK